MNKKAFSIIELSIVILIIGIIAAGVTQSSRMIAQMRLSSSRTQTQSSPVSAMKNLVLWLDTTSDGSFKITEAEDGANVTLWNDVNPQTTSKNNVSRSTGNSKITYSTSAGINGLPTLLVDGTSHLGNALTGANPLTTAATSFTYFIVSRLTDISTTNPHVVISNGGSWNYQRSDSLKKRDYVFPGVADIMGGLGTLNSEIVSCTYNGTTLNAYVNGLSDATYTGSANAASGSLYIASDSDSAWQGYIGEIIVFDRVLKTEERKAVENYLSKKWGIKVS